MACQGRNGHLLHRKRILLEGIPFEKIFRAHRLFVNLETKEKTATKGAGVMCPADGFVLFRQSELLAGRLGKATLGGSNKSGLFQVGILWQGQHSVADIVNLPSSHDSYLKLVRSGRRQLPCVVTWLYGTEHSLQIALKAKLAEPQWDEGSVGEQRPEAAAAAVPCARPMFPSQHHAAEPA